MEYKTQAAADAAFKQRDNFLQGNPEWTAFSPRRCGVARYTSGNGCLTVMWHDSTGSWCFGNGGTTYGEDVKERGGFATPDAAALAAEVFYG